MTDVYEFQIDLHLNVRFIYICHVDKSEISSSLMSVFYPFGEWEVDQKRKIGSDLAVYRLFCLLVVPLPFPT